MKHIWCVLLLMLGKNVISQENSVEITVQNGENVATAMGHYFMIDFERADLPVPYTFLITKKSHIRDALYIVLNLHTIYYPQTEKYQFAIPNQDFCVIKSKSPCNDLVAIPMRGINHELSKMEIENNELYYSDMDMSEVMNVTQEDVDDLKKELIKRILKE